MGESPLARIILRTSHSSGNIAHDSQLIPGRSSSATPGGESVSFQRLDLLEKLIAASRAIAMELDPAEGTSTILDDSSPFSH